MTRKKQSDTSSLEGSPMRLSVSTLKGALVAGVVASALALVSPSAAQAQQHEGTHMHGAAPQGTMKSGATPHHEMPHGHMQPGEQPHGSRPK